MERLVVILGAGSTMPEIPGVNAITTHLRQWKLLREPAGTPGSTLVAVGDADARLPLFEHLTKQFHGDWQNEPHFEQLMHVLELLSSLYPLPKHAAVLDRFRPLLGPFVLPRAPYAQEEGYSYAVQRAAHEILSIVSRACDHVESSGHTLSHGMLTLSRLANLDVFSLNYDDVPLHSGVQFETGYGSTPTDFSPNRLRQPRTHGFFQLHGSVLFGNPDLGSVVPRYSSRVQASSNRNSFGGRQPLQDGHSSFHLPMITGLRKTDKALDEPYASYLQELRNSLLQSGRWLIVGYGGGDLHINQALISARQAHLAASGVHQVCVVDHYAFNEPSEPAADGYPMAEKLWQVLSWAPEAVSAFMGGAGIPHVEKCAFNHIGGNIHVSFDTTGYLFGAGLDDALSILGL